jgi:hypothetical protein
VQNVPKLDQLPDELRRRKRARVLLAVALEYGGESLKANLLNLSATGALLDAVTPPKVGTELTLSRGTLNARGTVIWVTDHRFGIAFDQPVDPAIVSEHVEAITPRRKVVPFR